MQIKVCGLKEKDNLSEVMSFDPDYIGLIFFKGSPRYIGTDRSLQCFVKSIDIIAKVGVFVNEDEKTIQRAVQDYGLNFIQLHGCESPAFCERINRQVPVIKAFGIHAEFDFSTLAGYDLSCDYFLFDTATNQHGGSGRAFDRNLLKKYDLRKPFFLSGGIGLGSIGQIMALTDSRLKAVDVNSCLEVAPGIKDINKLKALFYEIRN